MRYAADRPLGSGFLLKSGRSQRTVNSSGSHPGVRPTGHSSGTEGKSLARVPPKVGDVPDVDVAAAGGWKAVQTLKTAYQQADAQTILRVVLEAGELREAK